MIRCLAIVEGPTERAYLQQLSAFLLQEMELDANGFDAKIQFYPKLTNKDGGGGWFSLVKPAIVKESPKGCESCIAVFVDSDIYIRNATSNERANAASYANKGSLVDFTFALHNFEDYLALHFDDELFAKWKKVVSESRHLTTPLLADDYDKIWQPLWAEYLAKHPEVPVGPYKKGMIPEGFVSRVSLANMIRHSNDQMIRGLTESCRKLTQSPLHVFMRETLISLYGETCWS